MAARGSLRQSLRLLRVARQLAAHDALFPAELVEELPVGILLLRKVLSIRPPWSRRRAAVEGLTPGERLALALGALGPTYIKLGQMLAARPDIVGDQVARSLSRLQDRVKPFPAKIARQTLEYELMRPVEEVFSRFEDEPVAAASIAQVHFAVTTEGRAVAVKVLRPDIERAFRRDLDSLYFAAEWAERLAPSMRRLRPREVVRTFAESSLLEMDLRLEAAAASELAHSLRPGSGFAVPKVDWSRTARRAMTVDRVDGIPIGHREALVAAGHDLPALAAHLLQSFLDQALGQGFFHADLHPGNLFVDRTGTIIAIDFGIMGRLSKPLRRFMAETLYGFIIGDYMRVARVHAEAEILPAGKSIDLFAQALRSIGEPIMGKPTREISIGRLLQQLFMVTETFAMETQPDLLLMQKTMVVVEGVARGLDPDLNMWEVSKPVVERWLTETFSPEQRLREAAEGAQALARRLPFLLDRMEKLVVQATESGVRLHPETVRAIAARQNPSQRRLWWWVVALLGLGFVLLALH